MEQLISAPTVQFKGSGWYVTDYAKKAVAPGSSSGNGSASTPSSEGKNRNSQDRDERCFLPPPDTSSKEK